MGSAASKKSVVVQHRVSPNLQHVFSMPSTMTRANGGRDSNGFVEGVLQQELQIKILELDEMRSELVRTKDYVSRLEASLTKLNVEVNKYRSVLEQTTATATRLVSEAETVKSFVSGAEDGCRCKKQGVIGESSAEAEATERHMTRQLKDT